MFVLKYQSIKTRISKRGLSDLLNQFLILNLLSKQNLEVIQNILITHIIICMLFQFISFYLTFLNIFLSLLNLMFNHIRVAFELLIQLLIGVLQIQFFFIQQIEHKFQNLSFFLEKINWDLFFKVILLSLSINLLYPFEFIP